LDRLIVRTPFATDEWLRSHAAVVPNGDQCRPHWEPRVLPENSSAKV
jgi:hypothetical protein